MLQTYALIAHEVARQHHGTDLVALLHGGEHVAKAEHQLSQFLGDLLVEGARTGQVRGDVASDELASYCLHALAGAGSLPSKAAVRRLVNVTLAGLRPSAGAGDVGGWAR
ncbi:MAG: SbtR family transcriptional regulator [Acidimicrobiales bacterium]